MQPIEEALRFLVGLPPRAEHDARHEPDAQTRAIDTSVPADRLLALDKQLHSWPEDFTPQPKLARQFEKRAKLLGQNAGIDWGHAEALSFATLIEQGVPIRLTGQDSERGTFSQRHAVLHDSQTGRKYVPLQHLNGAKASFEIYNSALSELAGIPALIDRRGDTDRHGRTLQITQTAFADAVAAGAAVVMGEGDEGMPVVIASGFMPAAPETDCRALVRSIDTDLFQ